MTLHAGAAALCGAVIAALCSPAHAVEPLPTTEIAPGVFVYQAPVELLAPSNRGAIANVGFIVGKDAVAVVDTGNTREAGEQLLAAVKARTGLPVRYVINTHMHPDHALGDVAFKATGAQFVAHAKFARALTARAEAYVDGAKRALGESYRGSADDIVTPSIEVAPGQPRTLDLGDREALALAGLAFGMTLGPAAAQTSDLVNRATLRICADPADMPLSNEKGDGYENKIAELLSKDLGVPVAYTWFPDATGFYRMTLGIKRCDVKLGVAQGADPFLNTNAFMRSTSIIMVKKGGPLEGVDSLSDERLKDKRVGVVAGTPPASYLLRNGLMGKSKPYGLTVDRRYESPAEDMIKDIQSGAIDAGVFWGPIAGYFAAKAGDISMQPLLKEQGGPPMIYRFTFGVRPGEDNWKHRLNDFIAKHQAEINKILASYHVPLVDEQGKPIEASR